MTSSYKHILVALDFMPDHQQIIARAQQLADDCKARISLAHIVEYIPIELTSELVLPQNLELEAQLVSAAKQKLNAIAQQLGIDQTAQHVELGHTSHEIIRLAEQEAVDLIIVGNHGRHGISRILGSTANAILHHAHCDVLTVRIQATSDAAT